MKLHVTRIVDAYGEALWVLFWEGEFSRPVAILTDLDMKRIVREAETQSDNGR